MPTVPSPKDRLSRLQPPATIVSPPSPLEPTASIPSFPSPSKLRPGAEAEEDDEDAVTYDSPDEDAEGETPVAPSDALGPAPIAATQMSASPSRGPSLLQPESPNPDDHSRHPPRSPSPSSPHYRPKPMHHRRTSSTHRVRETIHGEQRSTEDGERMINQYRIGKSLGSGAYATVELGVDVSTGQEYAVKEFSKSRLHLQSLQHKHRMASKQRRRPLPQKQGSSGETAVPSGGGEVNRPGKNGPWGNAGTQTIAEDPLGLIRREVAIMKKLDHPNIVHLYEAISVPNADALFLVLEYLPGGVLMEVKMGKNAKDAKPPFSLEQTREYFRQLCLGLEYLHENEVVHRDIKPDNVLLSADREVVKLCDFGVSEMFIKEGDDRIKKSGGSPAFLSPESFASHASEIKGTAVDIWALGVTLYCMLTGHLPFNVENPIELFEVVKTRDPAMKDEWHKELRNLLSRMLEKKADKRITMEAIRDHPWVTEDGENEMIPLEDNLYYVGKQVEEPTQDELSFAIGSLKSIFTVVRAVQKMRRLQLNRRSMSGQSSSAGSSSSHLAAPTLSPSTSTNPSQYGSMDSYASQPPLESDTSNTDIDEKWQMAGSATMSPASMDADSDGDSPGTERQASRERNPFDKLKPIHTQLPPPAPAEEEVVFASPTSEEGTPVDSGRG